MSSWGQTGGPASGAPRVRGMAELWFGEDHCWPGPEWVRVTAMAGPCGHTCGRPERHTPSPSRASTPQPQGAGPFPGPSLARPS